MDSSESLRVSVSTAVNETLIGGPARDGRGPALLHRRLLFLLKAAVTVGICALILRYIDWAEFWITLRNSSLWLIGLVVVMRFGGVVISSVKWRLLLAVHGLEYRLGQLTRWYFSATFLSDFLPTNIGGDAYRIYKTFSNKRSKSCAILAVLIERITGLGALVLLGYAAAIVTYLRRGDPLAAVLVMVFSVGIVGGVLGLWVLLRFGIARRLAATRYWPKFLTPALALIGEFRHHPRESFWVVAISFLFHVNKICVVWLLLQALGTSVNVFELVVAVAAADVMGLLPVSLGGLGVVDGSFIYVMGHFGVSHSTGLATMLLMRTLRLPLSLTGAYFYFIGDGTVRADALDGELATADVARASVESSVN
ncbi:MAG: flippase-like domain-containing protein [Gemmatimonadota bacterium]|nr:MAG: flippase-like domain-containing protein [Gemmatimonadota bacterium]